MEWVRNAGRRRFRNELEKGPVPLHVRFLTSSHLGDLQFLTTVFVPACVIALVLLIVLMPVAAAVAFFTLASAMGNWLYQTANRRIGVVDMFACEISSICRVCLVVDFAEKSIERFKSLTPDSEATRFDAKEEYTPVYNKQLSEMQSLSTEVVTPVTAFYTYRKAMMDSLRSLADVPKGTRQQEVHKQTIYLQYLMYESARHSVQKLSEFDPDRAESLVNILCSELVLFAFLLEAYANDHKGPRLQLRIKDYRDQVNELLEQISKRGSEHPWERARVTGDLLRLRYQKLRTRYSELALSENPDIAPSDVPDTR